MRKIICVRTCNVDGRKEIGEKMEVPDSVADRLIKGGNFEDVKPKNKKTPNKEIEDVSSR